MLPTQSACAGDTVLVQHLEKQQGLINSLAKQVGSLVRYSGWSCSKFLQPIQQVRDSAGKSGSIIKACTQSLSTRLMMSDSCHACQ